jgi:DNA-binding PadR family transcriptional regulator
MRAVASAVQQSEMSAGEIVLGLLLERPDTCYQLDKRMAERLGSAQFSRGAAAGAVKRLLERDLVRVRCTESEEPSAEEGSAAAADGLRAVDGRRKTVYEPTPAGVEHFRRWLRASTQTPPVREELHAKIALWGSEDVSRLIEIVREAEMACTLRLQDLNRRMRAERQRSAAGEWERAMQLIMIAGEVTWWDARIKWLQDVRMYLERQYERTPGTVAAEQASSLGG